MGYVMKEEGLKAGREEGIKESKYEIAKRLIAKEMDTKEIIEITGIEE